MWSDRPGRIKGSLRTDTQRSASAMAWPKAVIAPIVSHFPKPRLSIRYAPIGGAPGIFACILAACASRAEPAVTASPATVAGAVTDHVVIVSIDGLRADAIEPSDAPTLQRLVREGAV